MGMRKTLMAILFSISLVGSSFAGGPCDKKSNKSDKQQSNLTDEQIQNQKKKAEYAQKHDLRRVINANPQHAGYPKADVKGDFPSRINRNEYYVKE